MLKDNNYDIIHCHHSYSGVIFLLSGHFPESRRLLSYQSNPRNEGGLILFRILYRFFDRIILKDKPKETELSKVVYLPNGVNTSFFEPMDKKECKEKLGLDINKRYILFMDSYNRRPCKRIDRYSETLTILKTIYNHDNIEPLVLTNTGRSLIPSYVNASDLHLLTSDFEGSPNSVKECLACNVPVVSTPVGNVGDMLSGIEGTYVSKSFDPHELAELSDRALGFSNFSSRKSISDKGLDIESVARKLISVYHGMLAKERAMETNPFSPVKGNNVLVSDGGHGRSLDRPLKVLLINNCHYRRGGADVVYLNTGDLLESRGHEVAYFSTKSKFNYETPYSEYFVSDVDALKLNFVEQLAYMPRKLYSRESSRNLKKVMEQFNPDIAHIHLYKGGLTASILPVLKEFHIPVVITLHDYSLLCPRNIMIDGNGEICERCLTATRLNC
ncbi:glycosyltransferase, partial [bacterium]|nr:glycosyltransferase [bacterium]